MKLTRRGGEGGGSKWRHDLSKIMGMQALTNPLITAPPWSPWNSSISITRKLLAMRMLGPNSDLLHQEIWRCGPAIFADRPGDSIFMFSSMGWTSG